MTRPNLGDNENWEIDIVPLDGLWSRYLVRLTKPNSCLVYGSGGYGTTHRTLRGAQRAGERLLKAKRRQARRMSQRRAALAAEGQAER